MTENTEDLIAEAREAMDYRDDTGWFWVGRLADALEAASGEMEAERKLGEARQRFAYETGQHNERLHAAIERVRAVVEEWWPSYAHKRDEILAALDGAPEPEDVWEYEYADDDDPEGNVYGQFRRVVGPWLPVEGKKP